MRGRRSCWKHPALRFPASSLLSMTWRPSRAVPYISFLLYLSVSGKAYTRPRILDVCFYNCGDDVATYGEMNVTDYPTENEMLRLFFGLAFIRTYVKRSWKRSSSSSVPTLDWTNVLTSPMNALDVGRTPPPPVSSSQAVSVVPRRITYIHMKNSRGETTQPVMMATFNGIWWLYRSTLVEMI